MRYPAFLTLLFTLFIGLSISANAAPPTVNKAPEPPTCKGANILDEIKQSKPDVYAEIIKEAQAYKNGKSLLWRIEKKGVADSYLFGTVHITDPRVHKLTEAVKSSFEGSRILILEAVNLNEATMAKAMLSVMPQTFFSPVADKDLDDYLTPDEMKAAKKIAKSMGMPQNMVKMVKPWLIAISMALPPCEALRAKAGLASLDARLEADAKKMGKPAIGLETADSQLQIMASIPLDAQVAWLKSSIEQYARTEDFMETMVDLYLARDIGVMFPLSIKFSKDPKVAEASTKIFQEKLINQRNVKMVENARAEIDKGAAFIGVGALHLGGDMGIVELLRQAGYKVTSME